MTTIDLGKWENAQATLAVMEYLRVPDMAMDVAELCDRQGLPITEEQVQIVLSAADTAVTRVADAVRAAIEARTVTQ